MLWSSRVCGTLFGLTKGQMRLLRELETGFWKELKKRNRSKKRKIKKRRGRVKGNDFIFFCKVIIFWFAGIVFCYVQYDCILPLKLKNNI